MPEKCFEEDKYLYEVGHDLSNVIAVGDGGTKPRQVPFKLRGLHDTHLMTN